MGVLVPRSERKREKKSGGKIVAIFSRLSLFGGAPTELLSPFVCRGSFGRGVSVVAQ